MKPNQGSAVEKVSAAMVRVRHRFNRFRYSSALSVVAANIFYFHPATFMLCCSRGPYTGSKRDPVAALYVPVYRK